MIELSLRYDGARPPIPSIEWLRSPGRPALQDVARPAGQVSDALDRVRRAPTILSALHLVPEALRVTEEAVRDGVGSDALLSPILEAIDDDHDSLTALAGVHALARVPGATAEAELAELILAGPPGFDQHAVWALASRPAAASLIRPVAGVVAGGGIAGMHAQRVLARWAAEGAAGVLVALEAALGQTAAADARRYLLETVGLVPGHAARRTLARMAADDAEPLGVREAAIAAFADRPTEQIPPGLGRALRPSSELWAALHGVRAQRQLLRRGPRRGAHREAGIRVAQIHLGETGGLATLLPQLGDALAGQQRVAESITITRATAGDSSASTRRSASHRQETISLVDGEGAAFASRWPSLVAIARGIRAAFLAAPPPDVVHLRMADPGSLAGATVARELGIPFVFTLAPDPHGPIAASEAAGSLDRRSFASDDARSALWLRSHLVERLARDARELVLFPRSQLREQLEALTGVDISSGPPRYTVVPEGIDVARAESAAATIRSTATTPAVMADLRQAISSLPRSRHGLRLVVSVGRMHQAKGMSRLVEAFAIRADLAEMANLVIIGGNLRHPSASEAAELARIRTVLDCHPGLDDRIVLLGQRSNEDVNLVLAAARSGWGSIIEAGGAYVSASAKEEFGLAILEAMAAGLPVVAPHSGGPATYVDNGKTGMLIDTGDPSAIAAGAVAALHLASDAGNAEQARRMVAGRFTIERMARTLSAVYRVTAGTSTLSLPLEPTMATVEEAA